MNLSFFIDVISQDRCRQASFSLADLPGSTSGRDNTKPLFLKCLQDFWLYFLEFTESNTLLVDDTRYKSMLNKWECCICPPSFDPEDDDQDPNYLTITLLPWLERWSVSENPTQYVAKHMMYNPQDTLSTSVIEYHDRLKKPRSRHFC